MPSPRTLLLFLAGLALGPVPACLHVSGTITPTEPVPTSPPKTGDFAVLPSRPGETVKLNPKPTAVAKLPPAPKVEAEPKPDEPPPEPEKISPVAVAQVTRNEPGPLPIAPPSPALEPPLLAVLRAHIEGRPDKALDYLKALDKPNQDFVLAMMPVLVRGSQINLGSPDPAEAAVLADQLRAIQARLAAKAALKVERVAFCRKAGGFGRYEPWPEAQPYRPNDLAVLYVEVRHMASEPATGPHGEGFVTRANISLEVRDANGKLVEQTDPADWRRRVPVARFEHADYTHSPLRDYSRPYTISLPAQPGVYTLTVEVKDPVGNRSARSQPAEFRVAGP